MEVIDVDIPYHRSQVFYFYGLGDIHDGVIHSHTEMVKEQVKEIKSLPSARWLGMGDYSDLIMPSDFKRWEGKILAPWMKDNEDNIAPTQLEHINELLKPIWNQCVGLMEGNHEDSIRRYHHYDFIKELLKLANKGREKPIPYAGVSCFVALGFHRGGLKYGGRGKQYNGSNRPIIVHARHGEGSARTSGARALAVLRLAQSMVNAHITLSGHLHGMEAPDIPQRIIYNRGKIQSFEAIATMTGSFLRAYMQGVPPCYLERWGTPPSVLGCPRIRIDTKNWKLTLEKPRMIGRSLGLDSM